MVRFTEFIEDDKSSWVNSPPQYYLLHWHISFVSSTIKYDDTTVLLGGINRKEQRIFFVCPFGSEEQQFKVFFLICTRMFSLRDGKCLHF